MPDRFAITLTVLGHQITVRRHAIADTGVGIAGYFDAVLPDGRVVVAVGRWDDAASIGHADEGADVWCAEYVWVDGALKELVDGEEGSIFLVLRGADEGVMVEDIARAIHEATKTPVVRPAQLPVHPFALTPAQVDLLRICQRGTWAARELADFVNAHVRSAHEVAGTIPELVTPGYELTDAGCEALAAVEEQGQ